MTAPLALPPLAVSLGDPAGVGPELIAAAWARRDSEDLRPFFVVGGAELLLAAASSRGLEVPVRGISDPAEAVEAFASALPANLWTGLWIYFTAPLLGMAAAAELFRLARGARAVACAKLHHDSVSRCIFRCNFHG